MPTRPKLAARRGQQRRHREQPTKPGQGPAEFLTMDFTNWRERKQAQNLCRVLAAAPGEPLLVRTGNALG